LGSALNAAAPREPSFTGTPGGQGFPVADHQIPPCGCRAGNSIISHTPLPRHPLRGGNRGV